MIDLTNLYHSDYTTWTQRTAELLRSGRYAELDIEHLLEELDGMGKSEYDELESRLTVLIAHLLKWQYQYQTLSERWREFDGRSWRATIIEQRRSIQKRLKKSSGLKTKLTEILVNAYADAVGLASDQTNLPTATFPPDCPYTIEQLLDKTYYPSTPQSIDISE